MARFSTLQLLVTIGALFVATDAAFNCSLYEETCVTPGITPAYVHCEAIVALNDNGTMTCRETHLDLALENATVHCPHAQEVAEGPCAVEELIPVPFCTLFEDKCVTPGYAPAYGDCEATVALNADNMTCRMDHVKRSPSDVHCAHAKEVAEGPCAGEELIPVPFCTLFEDKCVTPGYAPAYGDCEATVALNADNMTCRMEHVKRSPSDVHCAHAKEVAEGPCADEELIPVSTAAPVAAPVAAPGPCESVSIAECVTNSSDHSILLAAVGAANLTDVLLGAGTFTLMAPTDSAFEAMFEALNITAADALDLPDLKDILLYHVFPSVLMSSDLVPYTIMPVDSVQGEKATALYGGLDGGYINDAPIDFEMVDIVTTNGVIHSIKSVIVPPTIFAAIGGPVQTIVDVAVENNFTSLVAAVTAADLVTTLSGTNQLTVFAPTDAAFADLLALVPGATLGDVAALPELAALLTFHVAEGKVLPDLVETVSEPVVVNTLQGTPVHVSKTAEGGGVVKNVAGDVLANIAGDVECINGIVFIVDKVMFPDGFMLPDGLAAVIVDKLTAAVAARATAAPVAATDAPTAAPVAPTAAPVAAPVAATDAPTAAPVAAPVTLEAEAKVDGLPDDFDTNTAAQDDFVAGVAALAGVPASDVAITSATKVTARRHLLASTFDIKYTVKVAAAEAAAVTAKVSDTAQITAALAATPTLADAVVSTAAAAEAVVDNTSGAASVAASMAAGVIVLFAMLV